MQTAQTRGAGFGADERCFVGHLRRQQADLRRQCRRRVRPWPQGRRHGDNGGTPALVLDFNGAVPFGVPDPVTRRARPVAVGHGQCQSAGARSSDIAGDRRSVSTSGARLVDARSGLAVNDIAADVAIGGGVARINRLTGTLSTRGSLSASGTVGINPAQGFPADLSIKLVDGRYTDGRVVTANLGGDLTIKGPLTSAPVIAGTVNLAKTVITVPDKLPGSLAALDVKHRERAGAPCARRTRRCARHDSEQRRSAAASCSMSLSTRRTRSSSRAGASTPNLAARSG